MNVSAAKNYTQNLYSASQYKTILDSCNLYRDYGNSSSMTCMIQYMHSDWLPIVPNAHADATVYNKR